MKEITGTVRPSREAVMKVMPQVQRDYEPFTITSIALSSDQEVYFHELAAMFVAMGQMRDSLIPELTNGAVLWDVYVRSKKDLDKYGVTQEISNSNSTRTDVSGAFKAFATATKQWSAWCSSMGLNLKSYGAIGIVEKPDDPKARLLDELEYR